MDNRKLLDALPLHETLPEIKLEREATVCDVQMVVPQKRAFEGCDNEKIATHPSTPPPKLEFAVESELTPGNIKLLGFDVALSPRPRNKRERVLGDSLYTQAFETALDIVLQGESVLFSTEEHKVFNAYRNMSYQGRFLYVRLFLRKRGSWFRVNRRSGRCLS